MTEELQTLRDIVTRLEAGGIDYMLTGSVALNCYAQPRMTRDIDLVVAFYLKDVARIQDVQGEEYYVSAEAARDAVMNQSSFNAIHQATLIKVDFDLSATEQGRTVVAGHAQAVHDIVRDAGRVERGEPVARGGLTGFSHARPAAVRSTHGYVDVADGRY